MNVVCLKWGTKFPPEYVNHLFCGVKRNLTIPFTFYCVTDDGEGLNPEINVLPIKYTNIGESVAGWWSKVQLFAPDIGFSGRVFYLDLDTLITGNIDHIVSCDQQFIVLQDFMHPDNDNMGSGIMAWNTDKVGHIWKNFYYNNPTQIARSFHPHGDQRYIQRVQIHRAYWQKIFPGEVVSFKLHCRIGLPSEAKLVCYHGTPSIYESINKTTKSQVGAISPTPWVKEYWKDDI